MWVEKETTQSSSLYRTNNSRMESQILSAFFRKSLAFPFKTIIFNFDIRMWMVEIFRVFRIVVILSAEICSFSPLIRTNEN